MHMSKRIFYIVLLFLPIFSVAQKVITGTVKDYKTKQPLQGASVVVKGGTGGTSTNSAGEFSLSVSDQAKTITISYVGYESKDIAISSVTSGLEISLVPTEQLTDIVVVGSRNLSRTRTETPVAVDIIPITQIANQVGQTDLNQILTYVAPSFQSSRQTIADGTDHVDPAQLRGLGTDQILVLINGKRRHQSALVNVNGTVNRGQVGTDLSAIPVSAIERVEVLRDGAAAQYGSDAIAGVINIVLKQSTGVLSGNVSYGQNITAYPKDYALYKITNRGEAPDQKVNDGGTFQAGLNYGIGFKNQGYMNFSGEYNLRDFSNRTGTYTGQIYPTVGGQIKDDSIMAARGTNRNTFDMRIGNSKIAGGSLMVNSRFPLGGGWNLNVFGGYNKKNGDAAGFYRYPSSIFSGAGSTYRGEGLELYPEGFLPLIKTNIQDYSISAAFEGKVGEWNASFSETFGVNTFGFTVDNSVNYSQFAVQTPSNAQTKFNAGELKFQQITSNIDFSRNFNVLHGMNLAFGSELRVDQYGQKAGEESSYRNYDIPSGAAAGAQVFAGFTPQFAGTFSRNNIALYADVEQDFTREWMVEGALRFENYSDFGSTLNYKLASRYKIADKFTIRAAASSGFRAPSMQQRFYAKTNTLFVSGPSGLVATESGTFPNGSAPAKILGIPELKQETSRNYSAGITAKPFTGLEITVDGYIINIDNRIVLTNNFTGGSDPALQALLSAAGAQTANFFTNAIDTRNKGIEAVVNYSFNIAREHKFRFTAAATFIKNEVRKAADGKPIIKASQILINSGQLGNYFNREDQSRIEVANPQSKASFMLNYKFRKLGVMLRTAYFGKVTYLDPSINPANPGAFPMNAFNNNQRETLDQEFASKTVTDISLSYEFSRFFTITAGANNVFDEYQDLHKHSSNMSLGRFMYSRRVQQMGFNGRFVFARVSFNIK
jgi:iron complex outermembrane receptor protein